MNKFLIIILIILCSFISIGQSRNKFKSYNGNNNKQAIGVTLTFLGAGFTACGIAYNTVGVTNSKTKKTIFITTGITITVTGLFTLIKK